MKKLFLNGFFVAAEDRVQRGAVDHGEGPLGQLVMSCPFDRFLCIGRKRSEAPLQDSSLIFSLQRTTKDHGAHLLLEARAGSTQGHHIMSCLLIDTVGRRADGELPALRTRK